MVKKWPPCIDCGDPMGSLPGGRCRDCDIELALEQSRCETCGAMMWNAMGRDIFGIAPSAHDDTAACPWWAS